MKRRFAWASALTLAAIVASQVETKAITNGVIVITTRANQDTAASGEFVTDEGGPGMVSPGDVAMIELLGDHGYTCRLLLDKMLSSRAGAWCSVPPDPFPWLEADLVNPNFAPALIIHSGSSAGADVPARNTSGIPIMMGEHTDLADRANAGALYMYSGGSQSSDPNGTATSGPSKYMKVLEPNHPIMQGIPLDAQGRVKIWRDPYPEEDAHLPVGGRLNYQYRWCAIPAANAAPATVVLGVLDGQETFSVFAVAEVGGVLAFNANLGDAATNDARLVHIFVNDTGSNNPRRIFNSLSDLGRVLFVRAAKWAMGETLTPYQPLGLIRVSQVSSTQIQLAWTGIATKNYKIIGTRNLPALSIADWQTVAEDIPGVDGTVTAKLDISSGPQYAFLRVLPVP
ncbi:MAG: hypothetical protein HY674_01530 [Chloroflexi bacterium]|nr:hypothetical protein [Chloroflexota bacterium]